MLYEREQRLAEFSIEIVRKMIDQDMKFTEAEKVLVLAGEILQTRKKDLLVEWMKKENLTIENIVNDIPYSQVEKLPEQLCITKGHTHGCKGAILFHTDSITSNDAIYWKALEQKRESEEGIRLWGIQLVPPTNKKTLDPE